MSDITDIEIGSVITFRSKAVNDNNFYHGKVIGFVTEAIAKTYGDVYTYNSSVQSIDNNVPEVGLLSFIILHLIDPIDATGRYQIPFATDWINTSTLNIISSDKIALIRVFDVDENNVQDVINLLKTSGFKAKVDSLS